MREAFEAWIVNHPIHGFLHHTFSASYDDAITAWQRSPGLFFLTQEEIDNLQSSGVPFSLKGEAWGKALREGWRAIEVEVRPK